MPITTMEQLAAIGVGERIEYNEKPYWRVDKDWWSPEVDGPNLVRESYWSGAVTTGLVLGPGEVMMKPGLVYQRPDIDGRYGILIEKIEDTGKWRTLRITKDGGLRDVNENVDQVGIQDHILDPQPPEVWVDALILMWRRSNEFESALKEEQETVRQVTGALSLAEAGQMKAEEAIRQFANGLTALTDYLSSPDPANPTGLKVGDQIRSRQDLLDLPIGTQMTHDTSGNVYTKTEPDLWTRPGTGRTFTAGGFSSPKRYRITSLPAFKVNDGGTGLRVGDLIENAEQFASLPVGTLVTYTLNNDEYKKFDNGLWNVSTADSGQSASLLNNQNRIKFLPAA